MYGSLSIGLGWFEGTMWAEEQIRNLTYVAITRERDCLLLEIVKIKWYW
jgi:hypothetical protein